MKERRRLFERFETTRNQETTIQRNNERDNAGDKSPQEGYPRKNQRMNQTRQEIHKEKSSGRSRCWLVSARIHRSRHDNDAFICRCSSRLCPLPLATVWTFLKEEQTFSPELLPPLSVFQLPASALPLRNLTTPLPSSISRPPSSHIAASDGLQRTATHEGLNDRSGHCRPIHIVVRYAFIHLRVRYHILMSSPKVLYPIFPVYSAYSLHLHLHIPHSSSSADLHDPGS